jgi:hypothetical protein
VIASVVVVPSAPALLPRYVGRADVLADMRAAAADAIRSGCRGVDRVVLVAAPDREPRHTMPPLGSRIGEHLLGVAGAAADDVVLVPWDAPVTQCVRLGAELAGAIEPAGGAAPSVAGIVVVADGGARRGEKAPGHLDQRAFAFDDGLVASLRAADPAALLGLDATLAADLLVHGRAPLQVAAAAMVQQSADGADTSASAAGGPVAAPWRCESLEMSDSFGVLHIVALLRRAGR